MTRSLRMYAAALALGAFAADDPPQLLPIYGGTGGSSFTRDCGAGHVLTGLRYRSGVVVDAIGLLCRPVLDQPAQGIRGRAGAFVDALGLVCDEP